LSSAPDRFIARQPIFDRRMVVHGYELLHRSSWAGEYEHLDPDQATVELLNTSMLVNRLQDLTDHKLGFVNVTENLILQDFIQVLPAEHTVLELLETVRPTPAVCDAVRKVQRAGHKVALDDFQGGDEWAPLVELADYLKIDFTLTQGFARKRVIERWRRAGLLMIAEKVETREEFEEAKELGFDLFQGYFFCRPQTSTRRDLPRNKGNYIDFLREVSRPEPDMERLEQVIKREMSLSAKLLRYLNSVHFGVRQEITSIRQALIHLGERPLKRWGTLIALAGLGDDKPPEIVRTCLVRARFCEQLATLVGMSGQSLDMFLTGMFSALDALTDRPLAEVLKELGLDGKILSAIQENEGDLGRAYSLAQACEQGDWTLYGSIAREYEVKEEDVARLYAEALFWADEVFQVPKAA
jgi:EAL and modified HD-GYP domain-containing signal transduction protein